MAVTKTFKLKKLRGKGVVRVDGQILLWREKRKKLLAAAKAEEIPILSTSKSLKVRKFLLDAQECPTIEKRVDVSTPVAREAIEDLWNRFKP